MWPGEMRKSKSNTEECVGTNFLETIDDMIKALSNTVQLCKVDKANYIFILWDRNIATLINNQYRKSPIETDNTTVNIKIQSQ